MQLFDGPKVDEGNHFRRFRAVRFRREIELFQTRFSVAHGKPFRGKAGKLQLSPCYDKCHHRVRVHVVRSSYLLTVISTALRLSRF